MTRRRWWALSLTAMTVLLVTVLVATAGSELVVEPLRVEVGTADDEVELDAALYLPAGATSDDPRPAVLLGHGFLSDRTAVDEPARSLAADGYVVLTWSARGFGASGGEVAIANPQAEIADIAVLVDLLATRPEILADADGDPRVAIVGSSYGGGTALLAATSEPRLDAVVAIAAWHSLSSALAPNGVVEVGAAGETPAAGVVKTAWTGLLFTARTAPSPAGGPGGPAPGTAVGPSPGASPTGPCGRFAAEVCEAYLAVATTGTMTPEAARLLETSSPAGELEGVTAPTLLVQGQQDTLFDLAQAAANAEVIAAAGSPVRQRWVPGGHAQVGFGAGSEEIDREVRAWLRRWLDPSDTPDGSGAPTGSEASAGSPAATLVWTDVVADRVVEADRQQSPGAPLRFTLTPDGRLAPGPDAAGGRGDAEAPTSATIFSPPGGQPAALSTLPGTGGIGELLPSSDIAGQHVAFTSAPQDGEVVLFGTPDLRLTLDADGDEARVFVKVSDVAADGRARLLQQAVTPVRATDLPADVTVELPVLAHRLRAGHRLRLTVATTDQAFDNLTEPTAVTLRFDEEAVLTLPTAEVAATSARGTPILLAVLALLVLLAAAVLLRRRRRDTTTGQAGAGSTGTSPQSTAARAPAPVVLRGLGKRYPDGKVAVEDLTLEVGAGQVMGLLGPNGAGKTSALRMLVGLAHPTTGAVELFGHRVRPGHPVLTRVGALIEGPGFVPELSGRENLELYWRAGGRALEEADLPWALEVAALGEAIDKPVKTYSHGMKQRLAIAQAMLGRPELLVLDEPTDGLDPEQIRTMRRLLVRLGEEGHTIVVSSHLLAEVEQMCTHVAVMQTGRLRAAGPVATLTGTTARVTIATDDSEAARRVLAAAVDDGEVTASGDTVVVAGSEVEVADLVALLVAEGIRIDAVAPRGSLEDAFLSLTATGSGVDAG